MRKIKNDSITIPMKCGQTNQDIGVIKKVRLTIKLKRSDNFKEIIAKEELENRLKGL